MNLKRTHHGKSKAQAMVEFAIALPLLLLLLYGIIETGRLLFIYSAVVTASRQAVRYGAATGIGSVNTTVNRYDDCDGIRAAAQRFAFLGAFDTVTIEHDAGPNDPRQTYCTGSTDTWTPSGGNTDRIVVTVQKQFTPIVKLVPFTPRTISATSARTILVSVSIEVTAPPSPFVASTPTETPTITLTPTNTPTSTPTPTATDTPLYTYTPSRTPTITLTPIPSLTPTRTITPTLTQSPVPSCDAVTHGPITKSGNTMSMTITNPYGSPLTFKDVTVTWNNDKGHQSGSDKTLNLLSASLDSTVFWSGNIFGSSTYTIDANPVIPPNTTVTLIFTFDKSYDNFDGTESIWINLLTPGCEGYPIQS